MTRTRSENGLCNKRSVLRRQCSDTNRNGKRLVYTTTDVDSKVWLSDGSTLETLDFAFYITAVHQPFYISI